MVTQGVPSLVGNIRAHGGMTGCRLVLVEQHTKLLMDTSERAATTADTMTNTTNLLAHGKPMATIREKMVATSCEQYCVCKFLLLASEGRYKPL